MRSFLNALSEIPMTLNVRLLIFSVYSLFVPRNERMHKIRLLALMYANNEIDVRFTFMTASFYCACKCN